MRIRRVGVCEKLFGNATMRNATMSRIFFKVEQVGNNNSHENSALARRKRKRNRMYRMYRVTEVLGCAPKCAFARYANGGDTYTRCSAELRHL